MQSLESVEGKEECSKAAKARASESGERGGLVRSARVSSERGGVISVFFDLASTSRRDDALTELM